MEYTVSRNDDLYVVRGAIPIPDSECLGRFWRSSLTDPVTDWQLANALDASMVIGSREACNACRRKLGLQELDDPLRARTLTAEEAATPLHPMVP